jgi:hypothetical protein
LVFSAFVVMWLSLMLQPGTIAATMPVETPAHSVMNVQVDETPSGSEQVNEHDDCPLTSAAGECCCAASGIHKGSEAPKRSLTDKNNDERSNCFTGNFAAWAAPNSITAPPQYW